MSSDNLLEKVKQLRELTGVGFKDCKTAIDENSGDIEKSIEYLRKKGKAKANKKMERIAAEGLVCISEKDNNFSIIEVNSETDFVAKNNDFIFFVEEISELALLNSGKMENIVNANMKNKKKVNENLVSLIAKIGEKITLRRSDYVGSEKTVNFSYTHSASKKNLGKIGVLISIETSKKKEDLLEFGKQLAMHIAATSPLSVDKEGLDELVNYSIVHNCEIAGGMSGGPLISQDGKLMAVNGMNGDAILEQGWKGDINYSDFDGLKYSYAIHIYDLYEAVITSKRGNFDPQSKFYNFLPPLSLKDHG